MEKILIKTNEVCSRLSIGRTKLYQIINDEKENFPKPVIKGHTNLYDLKEIQAWVNSKKNAA